MVNQDDKRFLELMCKQKIHEKRKVAVAKYPERVYIRSENFRNCVKNTIKTVV